jgi:hypothetical protein
MAVYGLLPLNLCFDLIILSSTAIFSLGWKKSWKTLLAWSINGCTLVNLSSKADKISQHPEKHYSSYHTT